MKKSFTSKQIADLIEGKLTGEENIILTFLAPPDIATEEVLAIAFEKEHIKEISNTKALCILVPEGIKCEGKTFIEVSRPKIAMGKLLHLFYEPPEAPEGIHPTAIVSESAQIGKNVSIGPGVVIGSYTIIDDNTHILPNVTIGKSVQIGKNCLLYPCVCIGDRVIIKNNVILHNGVSIGADGYSFITEKESNIEIARKTGELGVNTDQVIIKIPSIGSVEIHDNVEIGANSTIDRGTLQNTVIGANTKIDNLVMIAHNCIIGNNCFIVGQVGIAGSTKIGNRCVLAGQVGIADHLEIGDDSIIMAKSAVLNNLDPKDVYLGMPAVPRREFVRQLYNIKSIGDVKKRLKALEQKILQEEKV